VSVVVVTHNSSSELEEFVVSLRAGATASVSMIELIVVDSGSSPAEIPADGMQGVDGVVRLPNVGYGTAANHGIVHANADWIAIVNPDVRVVAEDLTALREIAIAEGLDMISPEITGEDGRPQSHFASVPTPPWVSRQLIDGPLADGVHAAWALHGSVLVVRRDAIIAVQGFDESYFLYFEEIDLAARLRDAGRRIGWTSRVHAIHRDESSSSGVPAAWRLAQRARGKCRFMRQQYGVLAAAMAGMQDALVGLRVLPPRTWTGFLRALIVDPRASVVMPPSPLSSANV
jgi:N-acetylglucosaminyl-diphospho-decaprenol L-rhamnosyltransferase